MPHQQHLGNICSSAISGGNMSGNIKDSKDVERIYMTFQEAQKFLGVSHQTIYRLMKQGLASHKIGKKRVFLKEGLIKWIHEH